MNFTKDWKSIEFINYKDKEPLPLAEVIPFIFKDQVKNGRASDMDGHNIMILYELSLSFHEHICNNIGIIYGMRKKDMVTICIIVNKNNNYLKYCKIIEPITTFLDLNTDILGLISQYLEFKEQLNLRASCETIKKNIVYCNYENSNLLHKLGTLIKSCSLIIRERTPENFTIKSKCFFHDNEEICSYKCDYSRKYFYNSNGIYSDLKVTEIDSKVTNIEFLSYSNFKILGVYYTFKVLLDDIEILKSLQLLIDLLNFDEQLRNTSKNFTQKDKNLMKQHKLSNHYYKTNDCYFKYNKDLKQFFDNSEWVDVVKDIICGDKILKYSLKELEDNILPILDFGRKVEENYDEIKANLNDVIMIRKNILIIIILVLVMIIKDFNDKFLKSFIKI